MNIQVIRHATIKIKMNHLTFLVDPMLSAEGEMDPVANAANSYRNPMINLPFPISHIIHDVDAVLLTHSHRDHFDDRAVQSIPKNMPIFCQPEDEDKLVSLGFLKVIQVSDKKWWKGVQLTRTGGQHGTGELGKQMGPVSGFIMEAEGEPSIYVVGDSIWCQEVKEALTHYSPKIVILNGGEAQYLIGDPITMGYKDIEQVSLQAPDASIIVVHMEAWNHCLLSREELVKAINENEIRNVAVPLNGEILEVSKF